METNDKMLRVVVQKIPKLPTLPSVAEKILGMVDDDCSSIDTIVKTVEQDPAIVAKVLSFANAAFYGGGNPVLNVSDAVMKIGFKNIRSIALGISLMTIFADNKERYASAYHRVFCHSFAVGAIANRIAERVGNGILHEAFIAGLLHDIGQLVINKYFNDDYIRIMDEFQAGKFLIDAERAVLGITHTDIGLWLADKWNLPLVIQDAICYHHAPGAAPRNQRCVAVVHLANVVADRRLLGPISMGGGVTNPLDYAALEILGLAEKDLEKIESDIDPETLVAELFD